MTRWSSGQYVKETQEILDGAAGARSTAEVSAAKASTDFRRWLAGVHNPCTASSRRDVGGEHISELHLSALRQWWLESQSTRATAACFGVSL